MAPGGLEVVLLITAAGEGATTGGFCAVMTERSPSPSPNPSPSPSIQKIPKPQSNFDSFMVFLASTSCLACCPATDIGLSDVLKLLYNVKDDALKRWKSPLSWQV